MFGSREWELRSRTLCLDKPLLMGIVNVTPDSFSDGGRFFSFDDGVRHALSLLEDGADILDIGGESTRPGSLAGTAGAIGANEEKRRILPLIEAVLHAVPKAVLSVDTYRASTARAAIEAGAQIVNDVSGMLWDPAMAATCAELGCGVVVMHTRGLPSEWASQPPIPQEEIAALVLRELRERIAFVTAAGIARERLVIDPGFGFGKRGQENLELLQGLPLLQELGLPLLVGASRKGFLGGSGIEERDAATHAFHAEAVRLGARILRVHDVRGACESLAQRSR